MQAEAKFEGFESIDESSAAEAAPSAEADRDALAARLAEARAQVEILARDLRIVDAELNDLAPAREQHQMLRDACTKLDELSAAGAAALFWGTAVEAGAERVKLARSRVEDFQTYLDAIEDRRAAIIERLGRQQQHSDLLEDDLFEALEEEERRQTEWIVEREIGELPARSAVMPWTRGIDEDKRFRKSLGTALLLCVLFALIVPYIPLPTLSPQAEPDVPDRVVRLMVKEKPKPVPQREQVRPPPKPVEQKVAKQAPVAPKEEVVDKAGAAPDEPVDQGILAFKDQFADLQKDQVVARLGSQAHVDNAGAGATKVERKMLTTNAPGSSGGINLGALSRGVSGRAGTNGMTGTQVTRVTSQIGGIGKPGADRPLSGDGVSPARTDEEIQIVFDRHKAALYRLYNRELRKDPTLQGQMVLRLTIEPDGSVSMCQLHASDMNAPDLATQVVERVKTIDFGAKEGVSAITILYPIDFLPAA